MIWVLVSHLGTGSGLGTLFLVMLGLMALRALTGASALAAVPIWVAKDAYCTAMSPQRHSSLQSKLSKMNVRLSWPADEFNRLNLAAVPSVRSHSEH